MNSTLIEFLLPSVIVTLFSLAILTVILRNNPLHSLLGIVFMGWTVVLLLSQVSARISSAEGGLLSVVLIFVFGLQMVAGIFLIRNSEK